MSLNLLELAKSSITPVLASKAGALFGLDEGVANKALGAAFPTLLSGVLNKSATPEGAGQLLSALKDDAVDGNIVHNLPAALASEGGVHALGEQGGKLLGFLFGDKAGGLGDQVAKIADVPAEAAGGVKGLTALAAPALFGLIKNHVTTNNLDAQGVNHLLANQIPHLEKSLPAHIAEWLGWGSIGGFLGGLASHFGGALGTVAHGVGSAVDVAESAAGAVVKGVGDVVGGTVGAAGAVAGAVGGAAVAGGKSACSFLKWLLPLLILLALAWFLLKSCSHTPPAAKIAPPPAAPVAAAVTPPPPPAAMADEAKVAVENGVVKFYFATGKTELAKGSNEALAEIVKGVKGGQKAVISGFHDSTGNAAQNAELAKNRAGAVQKALVGLGVPADKIMMQKPADSKGTGDNKEARRVEVKLEK